MLEDHRREAQSRVSIRMCRKHYLRPKLLSDTREAGAQVLNSIHSCVGKKKHGLHEGHLLTEPSLHGAGLRPLWCCGAMLPICGVEG